MLFKFYKAKLARSKRFDDNICYQMQIGVISAFYFLSCLDERKLFRDKKRYNAGEYVELAVAFLLKYFGSAVPANPL